MSFLQNHGRWVAAMALLLAGGRALPGEETADAADEILRLPAEMEKTFVEAMAKFRELKLRHETRRAELETGAIVKSTGLGVEGRQALEKAAAAAVAEATDKWMLNLEKLYRSNFDEQEFIQENLEQWQGQAESIVRNNYGVEPVRSTDQAQWKAAVAGALSPAEAAVWKTAVAEEQRKFDEQFQRVIAISKERLKQQASMGIAATASMMKATLRLGGEREAKLMKLSEQAVERTVDSAPEKARNVLRDYDEPMRRQVLKTSNLYLAVDEKDLPEKQEMWVSGLKELLSPEEAERWKAAEARQQGRRLEGVGMALLWWLDRAVAFTADQRERLMPLARQWAEKKKALFAPAQRGNFSFNFRLFSLVGSVAKEEELRGILDAHQIQHWREACKPPGRSDWGPVPGQKTAGKFEPEEFERALSDWLFRLEAGEREHRLREALLRAEEAGRVAGLEGKVIARLETAARGATEVELAVWRANASSNARSQMQNATPADFQVRRQRVNFDVRTDEDGREKGVWEKTVEAELTEAQRAAWQKEVAARKDFERQTAIAVLITEVDRICLLSEEQAKQLGTRVREIMQEYAEEIETMFGNRETAWFLQTYYALTPLAGIPEKEMKTMLDAPQWKLLADASPFSNATNYWQNIESNHKQRLKDRAKKK